MVPSIVDKACWRESKDDFGAPRRVKSKLKGIKGGLWCRSQWIKPTRGNQITSSILNNREVKQKCTSLSALNRF
jgi:hypothetical protein